MINWTENDVKASVAEFLRKEGLATRFPTNEKKALLLMLNKGNEAYPVTGAEYARVTFHCKSHSVSVDVTIPYQFHDYDLINELNLNTFYGAWQLDPDDGMLNFSYYVPVYGGAVDEELLRHALLTALEKTNDFICNYT